MDLLDKLDNILFAHEKGELSHNETLNQVLNVFYMLKMKERKDEYNRDLSKHH